MEKFTTWVNDAGIVDMLVSFGIKLLIALVIVAIGAWLGRRVQNALETLLRKRHMDEILVDFLGTMVRYVVIVVAIVAALDIAGIPATSLLAVVGAAGLAIGLALKDSLSNFAAGVMLALFRPFTKGDFVEAGGISGVVDEILLVNTRMVTPDNRVITIPNGVIWNDPIVNYNAKNTRRIDMEFGVSYDDDLKVASDILMRVCSEHSKVLKEPEPVVLMTALADSSVNFWVRPWVSSADYWTVRAEIMEKAKAELEAAGCSIPYPQRDIHVDQVNPGD